MNLHVGTPNLALIRVVPMLAMSFMNIPYIYGGKSPLTGLDCSGLASELLGSLGLFPRNAELGSQSIYDFLKDKSVEDEIAVGSLSFYGPKLGQIDHVGMFIDEHLIIEAAHGDGTTTTLAEAQKRNARVRVSPYNYRKDLVAVLKPNYEDYGFHV